MARPAPKAKPAESVLSDQTRDKLAHQGTLRNLNNQEYENTEWVVLQREVFNGWCKYQMSKRSLPFEDLRTDFATGVVLCQLLEVLSGKTLKCNQNPKMNMHYIENVNIAFEFMKTEKVKFKGWQPNDLVTGQNPKCPLALVWGLLQKYQFKEEDGQESGQDELLAWVNERLAPYNMKVDNFRAPAWQDGVVLSALVHSITPEEIDPPNKLDKTNALANTGKAMTVAQEELNIPRLFEPKALADGKLDDKSIKTYVSFFPMAAKEAGVGRSLTTPRARKSGKDLKVETLNPRIRLLRRRMQAVSDAKKNNPPKRKDDDLPKDIEYGKKQLGKCEAEFDRLLKEREQMKKEIETLNQKLKDANAEKEALQKNLLNATGAQKQVGEMDEKIRKLEKELAEWKARAEKAEKEVVELKKEIEDLKKQLRDKNSRITELETENLTLKEKVKNLEKKYDDERKKLQELEDKLNNSAGASDALREQLKKEKIKLEEQVKKLEDELNAARAEIAQLKNKIRDLEAENAALTKAKNAESEENKKLRERIKQLEEELAKKEADMRAQKAAAEEERQKAERERLRLKEEYEEKLRQKAREYERLKDEHDAAMNQLNSKARSVGMTQEELDKARDAELALKQDKRRAEDLLEAEKRDRRRDQQDADAKLAAKDREIAALRDEVNRLKKQEDENLDRIRKLQDELARAKAALAAGPQPGLSDEEARRKIAALQKEIDELKALNEKLRKYKRMAKEARDYLRAHPEKKGVRTHPGEIKMPGRPPLYNASQ